MSATRLSSRPKELRELLTEYGVTERDQGALTAIAQTTRRDGWSQRYLAG